MFSSIFNSHVVPSLKSEDDDGVWKINNEILKLFNLVFAEIITPPMTAPFQPIMGSARRTH